MALGESRRNEAFDLIKAWWPRCLDPNLRRTALLAIAMLRKDQAIEHLCSLVASEPEGVARDAINVLGMHKYDDTISKRVDEAARQREDLDLVPVVAEVFGAE